MDFLLRSHNFTSLLSYLGVQCKRYLEGARLRCALKQQEVEKASAADNFKYFPNKKQNQTLGIEGI